MNKESVSLVDEELGISFNLHYTVSALCIRSFGRQVGIEGWVNHLSPGKSASIIYVLREGKGVEMGEGGCKNVEILGLWKN